MELGDWLRLHIAFGAGNRELWQYIDFDDPDECLRRLLSDPALQNNEYVGKIKSVSNAQTESVLESCKKHGITVSSRDSASYPACFECLYDPPAVLFSVGDISLLDRTQSVAIVGARKCAPYSVSITEYFSNALAKEGINVISGFANGIDHAAHTAALGAGGTTVAFIGSGLLCDYPKGSMLLKKNISEHGAVISEYLPNSVAFRQNFKVRNRLIAASSECVLITEAGDHSGSLNTAFHAVDLGKDVFVVPPSDLLDNRFDGQKQLLREGAQLALSPEDIVSSLNGLL